VRQGFVRRVKRKGTIVTYNPSRSTIKKVGLILVADVPSYYLFEKGVQQVLGERGAGVFVRYSYDDEKLNQEAIREALDHDVEGLIVSPPPASSYEPYKELIADGFPLVLALASNPDVHSIFPDDHEAGRLMGEHFGEMGFRQPVAIIQDSAYGRERFYGFREGIARFDLRLDDDQVIEATYIDEDRQPLTDLGRRETEMLMGNDPRPDAVFAVNDSTAIAVYYWLLKLGLSVPEDMAVAGVDHLGPRFHPFQLTSVDIGLEEMGRAAAEVILKQLEKPQRQTIHRKIEPRLVVSTSTRRQSDGAR